MLQDPVTQGSFSAFSKNSTGFFGNVADVHHLCCFEESGLLQDNVDETYLVLASSKLVLQEHKTQVWTFLKNKLSKEWAFHKTSIDKNELFKAQAFDTTSFGNNKLWKEQDMERTSLGTNNLRK